MVTRVIAEECKGNKPSNPEHEQDLKLVTDKWVWKMINQKWQGIHLDTEKGMYPKDSMEFDKITSLSFKKANYSKLDNSVSSQQLSLMKCGGDKGELLISQCQSKINTFSSRLWQITWFSTCY